MKPLKLVTTPTRHRRLNELIGLLMLVAATLLLLALVSYRPTDPSLNTVGGYAIGRPAHNWIGLVGAWISDLLRTQGATIYRMKGVLSVKGSDKRLVFQGVHMLVDAKFDRQWGTEPRTNTPVFIGKVGKDKLVLAMDLPCNGNIPN